jgi:hypothetical protein
VIGAAEIKAAEVSVSIQQAVQQGLVDVKVKSRGGTHGDHIEVTVQRKVPRTVKIHIEPGTVFLSLTGAQHMAARRLKGELTPSGLRPTTVIVLVDQQPHVYLVEAYCLDYGKRAPVRGEAYALATIDARAKRIMEVPAAATASPWAVQVAVWVDRSGANAADISRRHPGRISQVDVRVGEQILTEAQQLARKEIPSGLDSAVRVEVERLFSTDRGERAAAAARLAEMGVEARSVIPFVLANVPRHENGHDLPPSVVKVEAGANGTQVEVAGPGVAELKALVQQLRAHREERVGQRRENAATGDDHRHRRLRPGREGRH